MGGKANIIAILLMTVVIWGAAQIFNTPVVVVYRFGYYGAAYMLGYFVFSHDEVIETLKKYFVLLFVLAAGVEFHSVPPTLVKTMRMLLLTNQCYLQDLDGL
jgi:hypothetical protein